MTRLWLICFILLLVMPVFGDSASAQDRAAIERQFQTWLKTDLWPEAQRNGVSAQTFNSAYGGVTINWKLPDLVPPGTKPKPSRPQAQTEFRSPTKYFNERNIAGVVAGGRQLYNKHKGLIARIEKQYGVPGRILLAIWGRESAYGRAKIPYNAFEVLGTKAFMATRKELFRKEALAGLVIIEKGYASKSQMKSSWGGAMGQPQFLPSSYLEHAVDFDGDGKRNIWGSTADTLASIANYLRNSGWQAGRDWGFEARIPSSVTCALEGPDQMRPVSQWVNAGVTRISGRPFPANEMRQNAALLFPAGRYGPVFVATPNFYVIKEYNNSDLYALFVGHVADRIQYANQPLVARWQDVSGLKRGQVMRMQNAFIKLGYDVGGADGLAGFKTRRSIGDWQQRNGLQPTCFPSNSLVSRF